MKLLVTGASGLFGSRFAALALGKGCEVFGLHNQHGTGSGVSLRVDVSERREVEAAFSRVKPDVVVHAAALTDVDKCELSRDLAWKINVEGTRNVVSGAKAQGAFVLLVSTDFVFDGVKGCYSESDVPCPVNYYGLTKLEAEKVAQSVLGDDCCVARASVVYGAVPAAGKVNFALWLLDKLRKGESVRVVTNQWNSPTLNSSLADMVLEVVERRLGGVFHLSGASRVSRFEFAVGLARVFGFDEGLVVPVSSADFSQVAKRPRDSSLDVSKAQSILKTKPLEIDAALERLKTELRVR